MSRTGFSKIASVLCTSFGIEHIIACSSIAALNRTNALSKVQGKAAAIAEAEKLNLANNHSNFTLLVERYKNVGPRRAKAYFQKALTQAKTNTDRQTIQRKIEQIT